MAKAKEKPKFEDKIGEIDREIQKRKSKWKLSVLSWMDYDDVSQILGYISIRNGKCMIPGSLSGLGLIE